MRFELVDLIGERLVVDLVLKLALWRKILISRLDWRCDCLVGLKQRRFGKSL